MLFEVAHQWFWPVVKQQVAHPQPVKGLQAVVPVGSRATGEAGRGLPEGAGGPGTGHSDVAAVTAATVVPVISVGSSLYPGPGLGHSLFPGLHPYTALQPTLRPSIPHPPSSPAHPHASPHAPACRLPCGQLCIPGVRPVFCWEAGHVGELPEGFTGGGWRRALWGRMVGAVPESW